MGRLILSIAAAIATLASPALAFAQSAGSLLPAVRSGYQQRVDAITEGSQREVFLGSASVAPNYGFPWMVSIQVKGKPRQIAHFCGGVAIAPYWVLTAAHCVMRAPDAGAGGPVAIDAANLQIMAGSNALVQGGSLLPADRIVIHPEFRVTEDQVPENDLALLHVAGAPALQPLTLPTEAEASTILREGSKVRIFGWGTASFRANGAISTTLLYAFVDVVPAARCRDSGVYGGLVNDSMFCAGLGFADACQGDSGGPAIGYVNGERYLVGITSWGVGCANRNYPGVYVNVQRYVPWIQNVIGR